MSFNSKEGSNNWTETSWRTRFARLAPRIPWSLVRLVRRSREEIAASDFGDSVPEGNIKDPPLTIASNLRILLFSSAVSFTVFATSLLIQWFVYYDWLHQTGPLRITGTCLATILTFGFLLRSQLTVRDHHLRMLRRFETIARANDRVRNALQTIECVTYLSRPEETQQVRDAVKVVDDVLQDVAWFDTRKVNSTGSRREEKTRKESE
jgi:hypothetical protein